MNSLESKVESLIFCSPKPIKIVDIIKTFKESEKKHYSEESILKSIKKIQKKFSDIKFSFEIVESGGGYQFLTKNEFLE